MRKRDSKYVSACRGARRKTLKLGRRHNRQALVRTVCFEVSSDDCLFAVLFLGSTALCCKAADYSMYMDLSVRVNSLARLLRR